MLGITGKYLSMLLLFLLLANDHFSWSIPQILLISRHRAARNRLSSFRRNRQRKTDKLNPGSGPPTESGCVEEAWFDIVYHPTVFCALLALLVVKCPCKAKKPSQTLYLLGCEFFVLQKTKCRAMLDKLLSLSQDVFLALSESTRAARCPCLLISLSQREQRSEVWSYTRENESWRAEAEPLTPAITPPHHQVPISVKINVYFPSVYEIRALMQFLSTIIRSSYFCAGLVIVALSRDGWEAGRDQPIA